MTGRCQEDLRARKRLRDQGVREGGQGRSRRRGGTRYGLADQGAGEGTAGAGAGAKWGLGRDC